MRTLHWGPLDCYPPRCWLVGTWAQQAGLCNHLVLECEFRGVTMVDDSFDVQAALRETYHHIQRRPCVEAIHICTTAVLGPWSMNQQIMSGRMQHAGCMPRQLANCHYGGVHSTGHDNSYGAQMMQLEDKSACARHCWLQHRWSLVSFQAEAGGGWQQGKHGYICLMVGPA